MTPGHNTILDRILPVVLVGGRSSRFGADKLLEPIANEQGQTKPLVSFPIDALRSIFGPRVAIVGCCDPLVSKLADAVIEDPYPGVGPVGGIRAALESTSFDVFICAGDLIGVNEHTLLKIISAYKSSNNSQAFMADDGRLHPTLGIYRNESLNAFVRAMGNGHLKLLRVLDDNLIERVPLESEFVRNVNRPQDITGGDESP